MDTASINVIQLEEIKEILEDVITAENIIDSVIEIKKGCQKGENFQSIITIVDVKGKNKVLNLVLKCAPRDLKTRKMLSTERIFAQESYFYNKVLPVLKTFGNDKVANTPFPIFPKCYKTVNTPGKEVIILQNMTENGYKLLNCKVKLDEHHVSLVLKEYGKFHAVSFALKEQKPELFSNLVKGFFEVFNLQKSSMDIFNIFVECAEQLKKLFIMEANLDLKNAVENIKDGILPFFQKLDDFPKNDGIIIHGDCWSNNMMFKYDSELNTQLPKEICFLDFQMSKVLPPVIDLSYFLYTSACNDILDNLEKYLDIYYSSLRHYLSTLGCNADELYPFSKLMADWREYGKFGFIMALLLTRMMLTSDAEAGSFLEAAREDKTPADIFIHKKNTNAEIINERLTYLVMHMYNNRYL